jgi:hypothetical protein
VSEIPDLEAIRANPRATDAIVLLDYCSALRAERDAAIEARDVPLPETLNALITARSNISALRAALREAHPWIAAWNREEADALLERIDALLAEQEPQP